MLPKFNVTTYHIPFVFSVLRILRKLRKLQVLIYSSYWTTKHVKKGKHIEISIRKKEKPRRCLGRQGPRHRRREHRRRQGEKRQFLRVHEAERTSSRICRRLRLLAVMGIPRRYVSTIRWAFDSPSQRERERLVLGASITEYREIDIFLTIWQKGNSSEYTRKYTYIT